MLVKYDAACRAITDVSEAKEIRNEAAAMEVYYKLAKDRDLEIDAGLIRRKAERRLGQLIKAQWAKHGKASGRPKINAESVLISGKARLADAGIDAKLSARSQAVAEIPEAEFEGYVALRSPKEIDHAVKNMARKAKTRRSKTLQTS